MKTSLDEWVEKNWDHKFLIWKHDERCSSLKRSDPQGIVELDFNPTAENLASFLVNEVGPQVLLGTNATLAAVKFYETRKCSVDVQKVQ